MDAASPITVDPKEEHMTETKQTFKTRLRAVSITLALTTAFVTVGAQAQTPGASPSSKPAFSTLHSFTGGADGGSPFNAVIQDANGNLYGTTAFGGASNCGTVYEVMPMMGMEMEMVLYNFTCGWDGANPYAGLVMDASGNLYGTTVNGGAGTCQVFNMGCGVMYELMPSMGNMYMVLHTFAGGKEDGATPFTGLVMGPAGTFYGTSYGGASGAGTVFVADASNEKVLFNFKASADGGNPLTGLTAGQKGTLYGTTSSGGTHGGGALFSIMPNGTMMTTLHDFGARGDGATPIFGSLVQDAQGSLYGTTEFGGTHNCGTVYEWMSMMGMEMEMVLYNFTCGSDGGFPSGSLHIDKAGNLFGTTSCRGCDNSAGTVFKLTPGGVLTTLHSFTGGADGGFPLGGLKGSANGTLYGTTNSGGSGGGGTVWSLTP